MPVYNIKEEYLREAIESILNQTFGDFEFIILNDGSTDEHVEKVIMSYKDRRIRFINNKQNQGFVGALNQCMKEAKGEYIAKMDSDDISLPERLKKQVNFLDSHQEIGLVGAAYKWFDKRDIVTTHPERIGYIDMLTGCCCTIPMFRREIVAKNNLYFRKEYIYAEDYDFYARFIRYAGIANIQDILYLYRWHGNNVSITKSVEQNNSAQKIRQDCFDFLLKDKVLQDKVSYFIAYTKFKSQLKWFNKFFTLKNFTTALGEKYKFIQFLGLSVVIKRRKK